MKKLTNNPSLSKQHSLISSNELTQIIGGSGFSLFDYFFPSKKTNKNG